MREHRKQAQGEVVRICRQYLSHVTEIERHSRDEACATLGKSWTGLIDIAVGGETSVRHLQMAINHLRDEGYRVSIESDDVIEMHVSTSREVIVRHRDGEEA